MHNKIFNGSEVYRPAGVESTFVRLKDGQFYARMFARVCVCMGGVGWGGWVGGLVGVSFLLVPLFSLSPPNPTTLRLSYPSLLSLSCPLVRAWMGMCGT